MKPLHTLIEMYIDDSAHYDDFNDEVIKETLEGMKPYIETLHEAPAKTYAETINRYKKTLTSKEQKQVCEDFAEYIKYVD